MEVKKFDESLKPQWAGLLVILSFSYLLIRHYTLRAPLPPGPPSLPLLGNIHQLPPSKATQWKVFDAWKHVYGPVFRLLVGKDTIVVLGDWKTSHDLLDRRATNFSSRPRLPMANELLYHGNLHFLLRPYGEESKLHRRMVDRFFTTGAGQAYQPLHQQESLRLIRYLSDYCERKKSIKTGRKKNDYEDFEAYAFAIYRFTASVMYMLMYGFQIETGDEHEVKSANVANDHFLDALQRVWPCDLVPVLNWLPSWLAPWKKTAQEWYEFQRDHHLEDMERGKNYDGWNLTKAMLGSKEANSMSELEIAFDAGVISDAGVDTTASTFMMFLLAAASNPGKVAKAHAEIDKAVGRKRLPNFGDKKDLPYVGAFISEVMRWRPVIPGGLPRSNLHDDIYNGYRIPRGSIIVPNFWTIHMDKETYGDPEAFRPERYLEDPRLPMVGFGFGRRGCIGQNVAKDELFIGVSQLLWAFEFVADKAAMEKVTFSDKSLIRPRPFNFRLQERDEKVREIVKATISSTIDFQFSPLE